MKKRDNGARRNSKSREANGPRKAAVRNYKYYIMNGTLYTCWAVSAEHADSFNALGQRHPHVGEGLNPASIHVRAAVRGDGRAARVGGRRDEGRLTFAFYMRQFHAAAQNGGRLLLHHLADGGIHPRFSLPEAPPILQPFLRRANLLLRASERRAELLPCLLRQ